MTLILDGEALTIKEIKTFLSQDLQIDISEDAIERVTKSRQVVERIIQNKETTAVSQLASVYLVMF